jgi:serine/threonine protein kinase
MWLDVEVSSPRPRMLTPDSLFHGRYRVIRCITAGAMGAVYEVGDDVTHRRRALEVLLPGSLEDADMRARFAQEATITGGIERDHIVRVSDAGGGARSRRLRGGSATWWWSRGSRNLLTIGGHFLVLILQSTQEFS